MATWLNGDPADAPDHLGGLLSGLVPFETCRVQGGRLPLGTRHRARLAAACFHHGLPDPSARWDDQVPAIAGAVQDGALRIAAVPRGSSATPDGDLDLLVQHRPLAGLPATVDVGISRHRHPGPYIWKLPSPAHRAASVEARQRGWYDALLVDDAEQVVEASKANVLWVQDGVVHTVPAAAGGLAGLAQASVLEAAAREDIPSTTTRPRPQDLAGADELYLTNATRLLTPVDRLMGTSVGPGPVGAALIDAVRF